MPLLSLQAMLALDNPAFRLRFLHHAQEKGPPWGLGRRNKVTGSGEGVLGGPWCFSEGAIWAGGRKAEVWVN